MQHCAEPLLFEKLLFEKSTKSIHRGNSPTASARQASFFPIGVGSLVVGIEVSVGLVLVVAAMQDNATCCSGGAPTPRTFVGLKSRVLESRLLDLLLAYSMVSALVTIHKHCVVRGETVTESSSTHQQS